MATLTPLPIEAGPGALAALPALRAALDGGAPVLPHAVDQSPPSTLSGAVPDDGTALVVGTSGSTGIPKLAMLPAQALRASARATHERLGGPGAWLLAMPAHHIAGVQVLLRCLDADTTPEFVDLAGGFRATSFAQAVRGMRGSRRYTALVPTQLVRVLADPDATRAAAELDGILVGGAASGPGLLTRARDAGLRVVTTYGMSETCGGCVYDGVPLAGSFVRQDGDGRLQLGGATIATGYLGRPDLSAQAFTIDAAGIRWFRTDDVGHPGPDGRWHVDGRIDDLVSTGGLKVSPRLVEEALLQAMPAIVEAVVVGVPDPEWGEVVAAAVVPAPQARVPSLAEVRDAVRRTLPAHALPRRLLVLEALPLRGPGKPDRADIRRRLTP